MKHLSAWLFAAMLLAAPALAQAPPKPPAQVTKPVAAKPAAKPKPLWAHLASDIAPDPAVTYGVLPNGMRYALMKNQLPAGRHLDPPVHATSDRSTKPTTRRASPTSSSTWPSTARRKCPKARW